MDAPSLKLRHIAVDACPDCGAKAQRWYQGDQHSSGEWNERVEFRCGGALVYSPNFRRVEFAGECQERRLRLAAENHTRDAAILDSVDWRGSAPGLVAAVIRAFDEAKFHHRVAKKMV